MIYYVGAPLALVIFGIFMVTKHVAFVSRRLLGYIMYINLIIIYSNMLSNNIDFMTKALMLIVLIIAPVFIIQRFGLGRYIITNTSYDSIYKEVEVYCKEQELDNVLVDGSAVHSTSLDLSRIKDKERRKQVLIDIKRIVRSTPISYNFMGSIFLILSGAVTLMLSIKFAIDLIDFMEWRLMI